MIYFYDIETIVNCFTATFVEKESDSKVVFVLYDEQNNTNEFNRFIKFLEQKHSLIGFNNIAFDAQVLQYIYENRTLLLKSDNKAKLIYGFVESLINKPKDSFLPYYAKDFICYNMDIYKMLHLDSKAKTASLKWCEFMMDWDNIVDMPLPHNKPIGESDISLILEYNLNDVLATKALYNKYSSEVELRKNLTKEFGIDLMSASEPRIAKEVFAKYLTAEMKISNKQLREMRSPRDKIVVKDIIFDNINFKTDKFKSVLEYFRNTIAYPEQDEKDESKSKVKYSINIGEFKIDYGLGGVHGCNIKPKIVEEDNEYVIMSCDITSMYPHVNFIYGARPEHIPAHIFDPLYKGFFEKRKVIPKKNPMNYVFKILLNSIYGLSKDKHSYLYSPLMTYTITINGQLLISMLFEKLLEIGEPYEFNTDGITIRLKKTDLNNYYEICNWWEKVTGFSLEFEQYKKMVINNVNNYISINTSNVPKLKGVFEWENLPVHKNKSMSIVPKALYEYFINDIPIEKTIYECNNIFMFCKGEKGKGDSQHFIIDKRTGTEIKQQKTNRYYVSTNGNYFVKRLPKLEHKIATSQIDIFGKVDDGERESQVEAGKLCTIYNKHIPQKMKDYCIDYNYYIEECNKIIKLF